MSALAELVRRALAPLGALVGVLVVGVAGFVVLGDVGVVEAGFWLLDPTSIEIHFQTHEGPERLLKAYALAVFAGLVLAGVWTGETVLSAAYGGELREELDRMQTEREIEALSDHVVICGYGMFGRTVADRLSSAGRDVVVVETDDAVRATVPEGVHALAGDARAEATLESAGIERADTLVAAIDDSNVNVQIAVVAGELAPDLRLVVRVGDESYEPLARRAGADEVVVPEVVSGERVGEFL